MLIVKENNLKEIQKLVQFILGVAVECENKTEYIKNIMKMDAFSQKQLMLLIEEIINKHAYQKSISYSPKQKITSDTYSNDNIKIFSDEDDEFFKELNNQEDLLKKNMEKEKLQWSQVIFFF